MLGISAFWRLVQTVLERVMYVDVQLRVREYMGWLRRGPKKIIQWDPGMPL